MRNATIFLSASLILLVGCASISLPPLPWQKTTLPTEPSAYKSAEIRYHVDAGKLSLPVSIARVEGQRVSFDEMVSRPEAGCAAGDLSIRYPHPDGTADVALVRLKIQNNLHPPVSSWWPSWLRTDAADTVDDTVCFEQWQFDMPKADLDRLLDQLRREGCFTQTQPHASATQLTIGLDGRRIKKPWIQSPILEATMQRVRVDGQLLALRRPPTPAAKASMTSSLVSYRNLVTKEGGGDSPHALSLAVSGLLMPSAPAAAASQLPSTNPVVPASPAAVPPGAEIARLPGGAR